MKNDEPLIADRIPTGISGLDKMIQGGLVKGTATLVSGGTGTGKTIFCCQFIWEGLMRGENCLFITFEESPEDIITDVRNFGWDFEDYIKKKKLFLEYHDPFQVTNITSLLVEKIKQNNISRVAIDSTSILGLYFKDPSEVRKQLYKLLMALKGSGVTTILTAEIPEDSKKLSRYGVEEFVADGVIVLHYVGIGENTFNSIQVRKMRKTNHDKNIYSFDFTDRGLVVRK
ncbi:MAG: ATPase domain-containing protein [Candidatus Aenigmatarchaeota archaeon]